MDPRLYADIQSVQATELSLWTRRADISNEEIGPRRVPTCRKAALLAQPCQLPRAVAATGGIRSHRLINSRPAVVFYPSSRKMNFLRFINQPGE